MSAPSDRLLLLERRIAALRKTRADLADPLTLQEAIIRCVLTSPRPPQTQPFPLPREQIAARCQAGVPLLHDQPVVLDVNYAADLFSRLVNAVSALQTSETGPNLEAVVDAATRGLIDPQQLFAEAFVQHVDHLGDIAAAARVDPDLLAAMASLSVAPLLRGFAQGLLALLEPEVGGGWQRGYCPICGGWPLLGELRGVELAQWLRCTACAAGWRAPRLACAYCGNTDYRTLGSLTIDGEQRFRVEVCERCKGYLKIGNSFDPPPPEFLSLDDVASLHLDIAAMERGYQRPSGSGYRIELALPEAEWIEELA